MICVKRDVHWKALDVSWWVCVVNHSLVGIMYLWLKEECQWIFTQDRWVKAIPFKPVNKTAFATIDHISKRPGQGMQEKKGRGQNPPLFPCWSRQHERCYICLYFFFLSLSFCLSPVKRMYPVMFHYHSFSILKDVLQSLNWTFKMSTLVIILTP